MTEYGEYSSAVNCLEVLWARIDCKSSKLVGSLGYRGASDYGNILSIRSSFTLLILLANNASAFNISRVWHHHVTFNIFNYI